MENPYDHESSPNGCHEDCKACAWDRQHTATVGPLSGVVKTVKTVDITPTWRGLLPALVELAGDKSQPIPSRRKAVAEARETAMAELYRLADAQDSITARERANEAGLTARDYQAALDSQNAVNASGLIRSLHEVTARIWVEVRKTGGGTDAVNKHPIIALYSHQIASLAGVKPPGVMDAYTIAYEECEDRHDTLDTTQAKD